MRLTPIDEPRGVLLRLWYWATRRRFGRTIAPLRVAFARLPVTLWAQAGVYAGLARLPLEPDLQLLLQNHTATANGCAFCVDIGRAMATYRGLTIDKLAAATHWRTSPLFSERERAALAFVDEANRNKQVSDQTFARLQEHFAEHEIVAITWLNAVENFFNLITGPLAIESDGLCAIAESRVRGAG